MVTMTAGIQYPNKLYVKIEVDPTSSMDLIDHFEFYVDDVAQKVNLSPKDLQFSAEGFAGGEQYEIYVAAFPKEHLVNTEPVLSNRRVSFL